MLKTKLMSALVLAAVGATAQAAGIPDALTFDGYCDGITGITDNGNGTFSGTHAYALCGGYTDTGMVGPLGRNMLGSGSGVAATDSSYPQFGASFTYVVNADGTWSLLAPEYGGLINAGTWTSGYGAKVRGNRPSFQK